MLKISEIFYSIQGEGWRQGFATIFIRLAGCNLRCSWCDTAYAWGDGEEWEEQAIIEHIAQQNCPWVCLTGGEPLIQDLRLLCRLLKKEGYRIQIETNGTISPSKELKESIDHWTVSPKPPEYKIAPGLPVTELKYIVNYDFSEKVMRWDLTDCIAVQPMDNNEEAIIKCLVLIQKYPRIKLSLQLHKLIGVR